MNSFKPRPTILAGAKAAAGSAARCWNIASVSDDEGEIVLYGDVVSQQPVDWWTGEPEPGLYITPEGFMDDLAAVKGKSKITVKLNSCGGDLYTGIAIHNAIKALGAHVNVIVEGIAASAASVIMCAGDTVQVYPGSLVMIHEPACTVIDYCNIDDLKAIIKMLNAGIDATAEIYAVKTGDEIDHLKSMMHKETWMTGKEAIENGFADELLSGADPDMKMIGKDVLMVAGVRHDVRGLHIPESLNITRVSAAAPKAAEIKKPGAKAAGANEEGGTKTMFKTTEELRTAEPQLVSQIEAAAAAEAVANERKRIQSIDEIAPSVGDIEMVQDAKYGEGACTAEQLAFRAMQKQAKLGTKHLENVAADNKASNAQKVEAAANDGDDKPLTKEQRKAAGREAAKAAMKKEG